MFDGVNFYNAFSGIKNLSSENLGFYGVKLSSFYFTENEVFFTLPHIPRAIGNFDIIIENEAGYGKMVNSNLFPNGVLVSRNNVIIPSSTPILPTPTPSQTSSIP